MNNFHILSFLEMAKNHTYNLYIQYDLSIFLNKHQMMMHTIAIKNFWEYKISVCSVKNMLSNIVFDGICL